uniref:Uncharacterized protein n=1 Tax=Romanomermis culicivorax TaxID=13658 RepID=A0A915JLH6_ROMCU
MGAVRAGETIIRKATTPPKSKLTSTPRPRRKPKVTPTKIRITKSTTRLTTTTKITTTSIITSTTTNATEGTTEVFYSIDDQFSDNQKTSSIGTGTVVLACGCSAILAIVLFAAFYLILVRIRRKNGAAAGGLALLGISTRSTNNTTSTETSKGTKVGGSVPDKKPKLSKTLKTLTADDGPPKVALKVGDDGLAELPSVINHGDNTSGEEGHAASKKTLIERAGRRKIKRQSVAAAAPKISKKSGEKLSLPAKLSLTKKIVGKEATTAGSKKAAKVDKKILPRK